MLFKKKLHWWRNGPVPPGGGEGIVEDLKAIDLLLMACELPKLEHMAYGGPLVAHCYMKDLSRAS